MPLRRISHFFFEPAHIGLAAPFIWAVEHDTGQVKNFTASLQPVENGALEAV